MRNSALILLLGIGFFSPAQVASSPFSMNSLPTPASNLFLNTISTVKNNGLLTYDEIKGSPYYTKEFSLAKMAENFESAPARYNRYTDQVEFQKGDKNYALPKEATFSHILFLNTKEKLVLLETKDDNAGYFFEVVGGTYSLYKKVKTKFVDIKKAANSFAEDKPAYFLNVDPFYYIQTDKGFIKEPKNQKEIIDQIPEKRAALETFFKSNKIKFNKEEDLIKLVNFLNQK
ncbi:hypothetical protein [Chryseobacterium potabilaquae]|uniref:Uncharacterized protein n=1 Tax=Chryseobacterium potabilaquae TaxID=2675057 RepID=A0A6N4X413_9FLAO|nr:hypothetical protein [Chryseobacterium potabilaquae]CAA7194206.1 hypothetical protein CHRY9293_00539 [Chryseobacterium potabilaquae]